MNRSVLAAGAAVVLLVSSQSQAADPPLGAADVTSPAPAYHFDWTGTLWATGAAILIGAPGTLFFLGSAIGQGGVVYPLLAIPGLAPWATLLVADLVRGTHNGHVTLFSLLGGALGLAAGASLWWLLPAGAPMIVPFLATVLLPVVGSVTFHEWSRATILRHQRTLVALPFVDPSGRTKHARGLTLALSF